MLGKVLGTGLLKPAMNKIFSLLSGTIMESAGFLPLHNGIIEMSHGADTCLAVNAVGQLVPRLDEDTSLKGHELVSGRLILP